MIFTCNDIVRFDIFIEKNASEITNKHYEGIGKIFQILSNGVYCIEGVNPDDIFFANINELSVASPEEIMMYKLQSY